jgi:phosphatidylserine/phosphatidylglycerophosphate/cardiolipin synthase-like enzyme
MRLLATGVTVSRTDNDLVRYHGKMMIIDRKVLFLLAFNFTYLDMERSRTFGIVTNNGKHVAQAVKLFDADTQRQPYTAGSATFVVSPVNARKQLAAFIKAAKKELLIYDPEISDPAMIRILEARVRAGVAVRMIGKLKTTGSVLPPPKTLFMRLHTRTIVRDGSWAFVGSQSLRPVELDARREVGIIFRDPGAVACITRTFEDDWEKPVPAAADAEAERNNPPSAAKVAKKVAKAVVEEMPPVRPVFESTLRELAGPVADALLEDRTGLNHTEMEATVKQAVQDVVSQVVRDFVEEASETESSGMKP